MHLSLSHVVLALAAALSAWQAEAAAISSSSLASSPSALGPLWPRGSPGLGGACSKRSPCNASDLFCNASRKCAKKAAAGATCTKNAGCSSAQCFRGSCLGAANRPANAPCSSATQCSSNTCRPRSRTCAAPRNPNTSVLRPNGNVCINDNTCQSGACVWFLCTAKASSGFCFKDAACQSGKCKDWKCTSSTTPPVTTPTGPTTPVVVPAGTSLASTGFDDGLGDFVAQGDAQFVRDASVCRTGDGCARLTATATTPASLTQTLRRVSVRVKRQAVASVALAARQTTTKTYFTNLYYKITSFSVADPAPAGAQCSVYTKAGGRVVQTQLINADSSLNFYLTSTQTFTDTVPPTSFAVSVECINGAAASVVVDDLSFVEETSTTDNGGDGGGDGGSDSPGPGGVYSVLNGDFEDSWRNWDGLNLAPSTNRAHRGLTGFSFSRAGGDDHPIYLQQTLSYSGSASDTNYDAYRLGYYVYANQVWLHDGVDKADPSAKCTMTATIGKESTNQVLEVSSVDLDVDAADRGKWLYVPSSGLQLPPGGEQLLKFTYTCGAGVYQSIAVLDDIKLTDLTQSPGDDTEGGASNEGSSVGSAPRALYTLRDGGFERGLTNDDYWTSVNGAINTDAARTGAWSRWVGYVYSPENYPVYLQQTLKYDGPSDLSESRLYKLGWWMRLEELRNKDTAPEDDTVPRCQLTASYFQPSTNDWTVAKSFVVSRVLQLGQWYYASNAELMLPSGGGVQLKWDYKCSNDVLQSSFRIDDVSLEPLYDRTQSVTPLQDGITLEAANDRAQYTLEDGDFESDDYRRVWQDRSTAPQPTDAQHGNKAVQMSLVGRETSEMKQVLKYAGTTSTTGTNRYQLAWHLKLAELRPNDGVSPADDSARCFFNVQSYDPVQNRNVLWQQLEVTQGFFGGAWGILTSERDLPTGGGVSLSFDYVCLDGVRQSQILLDNIQLVSL